jgi:hypothetical protein
LRRKPKNAEDIILTAEALQAPTVRSERLLKTTHCFVKDRVVSEDTSVKHIRPHSSSSSFIELSLTPSPTRKFCKNLDFYCKILAEKVSVYIFNFGGIGLLGASKSS